MDAPLKHITRLLEALKTKTGQEMSNKGFKVMAEMIDNGVTGKYLYDNLSRGITQARSQGKDTLGLNETQLDKIAEYLGFPTFRAFCLHIDRPIDMVLKELEGSYYSYVRRNSPDTVIFRSPVRIWEEAEAMKFQLCGPQWTYEGEVALQLGCLFVLMRSREGKEFHHIYKIGKRRRPRVLQGIFSGVSTSFDPIGGRALLIRQDADFTSLKGGSITKADNNGTEEEKRVTTYFQHYDRNNLIIERVTTFELDDLG